MEVVAKVEVAETVSKLEMVVEPVMLKVLPVGFQIKLLLPAVVVAPVAYKI
jgi:hypothetical protein